MLYLCSQGKEFKTGSCLTTQQWQGQLFTLIIDFYEVRRKQTKTEPYTDFPFFWKDPSHYEEIVVYLT